MKEKARVININVDISNYENVLQDCEKLDMICEQREKISIIEKTVKAMKEDDIFIFNCYYYSSMKINEIANILNVSEFNVKLSDQYNIRNMMFGMTLYDLKIVDENGKKVFATHELEAEEMQIYKTEQEAKENYDAYTGGYSSHSDIMGENELMHYLTATQSGESFPKSKKLYVTFTRIHVRKDQYEQPLNEWYKGDWKFELDVPEEMYNREITTYKVKSCSEENTIVNNAILSNTSFIISIPYCKTDKVDYGLLSTSTPKSIYDKIAFQKEYVETSDGKRFEVSRNIENGYGVPAGTEQIENYTQTFDLTKYDATDELTVHIFTNKGEEIIIEYEKVQ